MWQVTQTTKKKKSQLTKLKAVQLTLNVTKNKVPKLYVYTNS